MASQPQQQWRGTAGSSNSNILRQRRPFVDRLLRRRGGGSPVVSARLLTSSSSSSSLSSSEEEEPAMTTIRKTTSQSLFGSSAIAAATAVATRNTVAQEQQQAPASNNNNNLRMLHLISFLTFLSSSLVALSPAQALAGSGSGEQTATILSMITATAALTEIGISRQFGGLLDVAGRKPALLGTVGAMTIVNALTSQFHNVWTIGFSKYAGMLSVGFFLITTQAMMSDLTTKALSNNGNSNFAAASAASMAVTGLAFLVGVLVAGRLAETFGLFSTYTASAGLGALTLLTIQLGLRETLLPNKNRAAVQQPQAKEEGARWTFKSNPLVSCTRLLTNHGKEVRVLGILLMLNTLPMFMGDFFQIFANTEWNLSHKDFANFLALYGVTGIVANTMGSALVKKLGIRKFTCVAILSKMITSVGTAFFGYRGSMIGLMLGFLGAAQSIGIVAALVSAGSAYPQGIMAGERASLIALLKIFGPLFYSTLYIQGEKWLGICTLPFLFNIGLSFVALAISFVHLP